ncbi:hypothetical protein HYDPIDRAFT_119687 [Hydnomerulius pinastri MD-312]|uniref:Uncharacterized protein n=1 Tax=Hydnomerulius pinastri MD-312 TaxID=994086 RepID=A0A0C9W7C8_9AGAM|nr:hypothetical protein HYDPIDRAFT_119687 [Hydnomerulius pinastri MD-312]
MTGEGEVELNQAFSGNTSPEGTICPVLSNCTHGIRGMVVGLVAFPGGFHAV